jgi:DNA-binding response OmpR family regulator
MYEADRGVAPLTYDKPHIQYPPLKGTGGIPVMVVDDNSLVLEVLSENLTRYGFKVTSAEDAFEALSFLDREDYKLVITDFQMPGMDGLALASTIKKRYPAMIVILTTGMDKGYFEEIQGMQNIDLFIPKPFNMRTFLAGIGKMLKQ